MKKKMFVLFAVMMMAATAFAQFENGKYYLNASLSGIDLNYDKGEKWKVDVSGKLGYLFADNWMVLANMEYGYHNELSTLKIGPALRYYIIQNGVYLGAGANYVHRPVSFNDIMPNLSVGYAFFLNGMLTVEPEIYYNHSFKNHDYSGIGLRVGLGVYF